MFVVKFFVIIAVEALLVAPSLGDCEASRSTAGSEGNVGQTALFPWLGVLRVHIHEGHTFKVALTGIVLVKKGYAVANADDVSRIPKRIFKHDSSAMFVPTDKQPWFCKLLDYMTHPEYEFSTINTIALIELDPGEDKHYPMKAICWPPRSYDTSKNLYAIGFTDDNKLLEKTVYLLQNVDKKLCKEFYNRAGLMESNMVPSHYQCGFAKSNKENCVWDNGMVMASNTTGHWILIGFGIRGPGCAAPARFIDMQRFLPWVESATNLEEVDDTNYRKSAFNEGFRPNLREGDEITIRPDLESIKQNVYHFDTALVNDFFTIDRIDQNAINIRNITIPGQAGDNCNDSMNRIIYHDEMRVVADRGRVSYKISLYDLNYINYACVKITLESTQNDNASIYYMAKIENTEGTSFGDLAETPDEILKTYIMKKIEAESDKKPDVADWEPGSNLKVAFLEDKNSYIKMKNYNIYLRFMFESEGMLDVKVLGPKPPKPSRRAGSDETLERTEIPDDEVEADPFIRDILRSLPKTETGTETVAETVTETETETVNETVTETVTETVAETVAEKINETVNETVTETVTETVAETINETVTETVAETVTETVAETITETVTETETETVNETVTEPSQTELGPTQSSDTEQSTTDTSWPLKVIPIRLKMPNSMFADDEIDLTEIDVSGIQQNQNEPRRTERPERPRGTKTSWTELSGFEMRETGPRETSLPAQGHTELKRSETYPNKNKFSRTDQSQNEPKSWTEQSETEIRDPEPSGTDPIGIDASFIVSSLAELSRIETDINKSKLNGTELIRTKLSGNRLSETNPSSKIISVPTPTSTSLMETALVNRLVSTTNHIKSDSSKQIISIEVLLLWFLCRL